VAVRRPGLDANSPSGHSCRFLFAPPQFAPVVIHTRNAKVRLPRKGWRRYRGTAPSPSTSMMARMKSSGLLNAVRISFFIMVTVPASFARPFTSIKRKLQCAESGALMCPCECDVPFKKV